MKHTINAIWLATPNRVFSHLPCMNSLFTIKVKILVPTKWSYRSMMMSIAEPRMVSIFWGCKSNLFQSHVFLVLHQFCCYVSLTIWSYTYLHIFTMNMIFLPSNDVNVFNVQTTNSTFTGKKKWDDNKQL